MSGKIKWNELKTRIEPTNYSIPKRLISSRGRKNNKEIPTWSFLKNEVFKDDVSKIIITIIEIDVSKFSPTYIESCVLQKIYSTKNIIPKFNNHF